MYRRAVVLAGITAALAGCTSPQESPAGDELVADALEARERHPGLEATRTIHVDGVGDPIERIERFHRGPPDNLRREVLESTDPRQPAGTVTVRNPKTSWEYDPTTDEVFVRHHPTRLTVDRTRQLLDSLLDGYDLAYEGTKVVDGTDAYVVEATPIDPAEVGAAIVLAVGSEQYQLAVGDLSAAELEEAELRRTIAFERSSLHPIEERTTVTVDGEVAHELAVRFESFEHTELPAETFEYEPPAGATVVERGSEPEAVFDTVAAANPTVPYEIPDPGLPRDLAVDRVVVTEADDVTTTRVWYATEYGRRDLYLELREDQRFDEDVLAEVDLDGRTVYRRDGHLQSVFWTCGGVSHEVSSPTDGDLVEAVAAAVDCR